jgi:hypothetical protein
LTRVRSDSLSSVSRLVAPCSRVGQHSLVTVCQLKEARLRTCRELTQEDEGPHLRPLTRRRPLDGRRLVYPAAAEPVLRRRGRPCVRSSPPASTSEAEPGADANPCVAPVEAVRRGRDQSRSEDGLRGAEAVRSITSADSSGGDRRGCGGPITTVTSSGRDTCGRRIERSAPRVFGRGRSA